MKIHVCKKSLSRLVLKLCKVDFFLKIFLGLNYHFTSSSLRRPFDFPDLLYLSSLRVRSSNSDSQSQLPTELADIQTKENVRWNFKFEIMSMNVQERNSLHIGSKRLQRQKLPDLWGFPDNFFKEFHSSMVQRANIRSKVRGQPGDFHGWSLRSLFSDQWPYVYV